MAYLENIVLNATGNTTQGSSMTQNINALTFQGTGGVSVGMSNGSVVISGNTGGGGGGVTLSYFNPQDAYVQVTGQLGQASLFFQPMQAPNVQFDQIAVPVVFTATSNSSNSFTVSLSMGTYTRNGSTLSLLNSVSTSYDISLSGTAGSYSLYGGLRLLTIPYTSTLTEGQYWVGIASRTTTAGGAGMSMSNVVASQMNSTFSGLFGAATNATVQYTRGLGRYTQSTTAIPSAVQFSEIQGNSSAFIRQPLFYMVSQTF